MDADAGAADAFSVSVLFSDRIDLKRKRVCRYWMELRDTGCVGYWDGGGSGAGVPESAAALCRTGWMRQDRAGYMRTVNWIAGGCKNGERFFIDLFCLYQDVFQITCRI